MEGFSKCSPSGSATDVGSFFGLGRISKIITSYLECNANCCCGIPLPTLDFVNNCFSVHRIDEVL